MAEQHPIEGLMKTAMESIREMVDVNTIVGDAVQSPDGAVIIPISRVTFGFAAGGGEYTSSAGDDSQKVSRGDDEENCGTDKFPFAGGSGAGVSINPVAFMVVGNGQIKLLPVNINSTLDKILDLIPEIFCKLENAFKKNTDARKESKTGENVKSAKSKNDDDDE